MRFSFLIILIFISFGASAQVYQNMAQPGYKFGRARFDSVLTIPTGLGAMRNITGGQDTGQIRFNVSDSSVYVWNGRRWVKPVGGGISDTLKVSVSDTAAMLANYAKTAAVALKVNISDTAAMLSPYVRAASLTIPTLTQVLEAAPGSNEAGANQIKDLSAGTSQNDAATFGQLTDTANLRLRLSDTSAMLSRYLDTLQAHNTRIISAGGGGGSTGWALTGNASAVTDFLGTTNNRTMRFRTNNVERMVIDSIGNINFSSASIFGYPYSLNTSSSNPTASGLDSGTISIYRGAYKIGIDASASVYLQSGNPLSTDLFVFYKGATKQNSKIDANGNFSVASGGRYILNAGDAPANPTANPQANTISLYDVVGNNWKMGIAAARASKFDMYFSTGASSGGGFRWYQGTTELASISQAGNLLLGGNTTDAASALLNMASTSKGLLIPRMTLTQRNAIASPAAGLQVIVTGETGGEFLSFYNGTTAAWQRVVKLTSAGRLLLGTTTELTHILDVVGTARVSGQMSINGYTISSPGNGSIKIGSNPNTTGSGVTAVGEGAITTNSYSNSSAFGLGSLGLGGGNRVSAFGWYAGYSNNGSFNTYVGAQSGWNQTTGANNVFLGDRAGDKISGGSTNLTIANNSILIGQNTKALADNQTNQIVIGYDETGLGSNTTIIGNSSTVTTAIRGRVLIGTTTVDASAALNITSTTQGVLFPRMTTAQKTAIGSPAAGLQVYDTTLNQMSYFNGTTWVNF
jgi:hypothetical protein